MRAEHQQAREPPCADIEPQAGLGADARRVAGLLGNLNAKVNLIALNPGPGIAFETPEPEQVASFQAIVRRSLPCFVRKPRGLDVYAACGQLKRTVS